MSSHPVNELKKTPMYSYYMENKIKLVDFGGWALPIQYESILKEHKAVRECAGLFDVSHMGQIIVEGEHAEEWLNTLVTNDLTQLNDFQAQYHAVCKEDGGTLDDLIILKLGATKYFVTPNASNTEKIYSWLKKHETEGVSIRNVSEQYGLLALQGPKAEMILQSLTDSPLSMLKPFYSLPSLTLQDGTEILASRTGYTGEDGFELYCKVSDTQKVWDSLLMAGEAEGLIPCGLGARDTLRLEMGFPLYGQELSEEITPIEAGIGFAVKTKTKKADFIGKSVLSAQRITGTDQKICGIQLEGRGIPRTGYAVLDTKRNKIGVVTSGSKSPSLGTSIGLALLNTEETQLGTSVFIQVRKKEIPAVVAKKKFYTQK